MNVKMFDAIKRSVSLITVVCFVVTTVLISYPLDSYAVVQKTIKEEDKDLIAEVARQIQKVEKDKKLPLVHVQREVVKELAAGASLGKEADSKAVLVEIDNLIKNLNQKDEFLRKERQIIKAAVHNKASFVTAERPAWLRKDWLSGEEVFSFLISYVENKERTKTGIQKILKKIKKFKRKEQFARANRALLHKIDPIAAKISSELLDKLIGEIDKRPFVAHVGGLAFRTFEQLDKKEKDEFFRMKVESESGPNYDNSQLKLVKKTFIPKPESVLVALEGQTGIGYAWLEPDRRAGGHTLNIYIKEIERQKGDEFEIRWLLLETMIDLIRNKGIQKFSAEVGDEKEQEFWYEVLQEYPNTELKDSTIWPMVVFDLTKGQSLGKPVETHIYRNNEIGFNQIFDSFDPKQVDIRAVFNPVPSGKFRFNHLIRKGGFNENDWRELPELSKQDLGDVHLPYRNLLSNVNRTAAKQNMNLFAYSASNLYWNDWFAIYDGASNRLYHSRGEPFDQRIYPMLVIWEDGRATAEELRFSQNDDGTYSAFKAKDKRKKKPLAGIKSAVFGQRLIQKGEPVPLEAIGYQFEDIYHLYRLPQFIYPEKKGTDQYGDSIGLDELKGSIERPLKADDLPVLKSVIQNDGYMRVDITQYLLPEQPIEEAISEFKRKALGAHQYEEAPPEKQSPDQLNRGEFYIENDSILHVRLKPSRYPHNLIGITKSGRVLSVVLPGNKAEGKGYTITGAQKTIMEHQAKAEDPVQDLFLMANSRDVFRIVNGIYEKGAHSDNHYHEGTAMLSFLVPVTPKDMISRPLEMTVETDGEPITSNLIVDFIRFAPEETIQSILHGLSNSEHIKSIIRERGPIERIQIRGHKGYSYKNIYRADVTFTDKTQKKCEIEVYGLHYGLFPRETMTLEEAVATLIINLGRSYDNEESVPLFDELDLGDQSLRDLVVKASLRKAIETDTFHFEGFGTDAVVWANAKNNYVIKSLMPVEKRGFVNNAFENYEVGKEKLGGTVVKFLVLNPIKINVDTGIAIREKQESEGKTIFVGIRPSGKQVTVEREETEDEIRIKIVDENGQELSAFEPLTSESAPSRYGYEIMDIFAQEIEPGREVLISKVRIENVVAQKYVPILLEKKILDDSTPSFRGVLFDFMKENETSRILYFLDQYFALIQNIWRRGFHEYNFHWDNIALDLSFGELGMIDLGKTIYAVDDYMRDFRIDEAPKHLGMFTRGRLIDAMKASEFKEADVVLKHFDEGLRKYLNIEVPGPENKFARWIDENAIQRLIGLYDQEVPISYFGPGFVRKKQLRDLSTYLKNNLRYGRFDLKKLRRKIAAINVNNEKYFWDILSALIPKNISAKGIYVMDEEIIERHIVRIHPPSGQTPLNEVLDKKKLNGETLDETEIKALRIQTAQIMIHFIVYYNKLYKYIAGKLGLDRGINPKNPLEIRRVINSIDKVPDEEVYNEVISLLKLEADYGNETAETFRKKLLNGFRLARHRQYYPSHVDLSDFDVEKDEDGNLLVVLRNFGPLLQHRREYQTYKDLKILTSLSFNELADAILHAVPEDEAYSFLKRVYYQADLDEVEEYPVRAEIDRWLRARGDYNAIVRPVEGQSLGKKYGTPEELRKDIENKVEAPIPAFLHLKDAARLSKTDIDELILFILRKQIKMVFHGGKESGLTLADIDPDLASISEGVYYHYGDEVSAYETYGKSHKGTVIHLSKEINIPTRPNALRFRYQKGQAGTLTAAIAYVINDGNIRGIIRDENGYFILDLTEKLADIVREYQAEFELARAA